MRCDCNYCIYNENNVCLLSVTQLNELGMCEECIIVSIPDAQLQKLKQTQ